MDAEHVIRDGAVVKLRHLFRVCQNHGCGLGPRLEGASSTRVEKFLVVIQVKASLAGFRDYLPRLPELSELGPVDAPADAPHKVPLACEGC